MAEVDQSVLRALLDLTDLASARDESAALLERLAQHAVSLLPAACCAVAAADEDGELSVLRCSDGVAWTLGFTQLEKRSGPLVDCFRLGVPVQCPDILSAPAWPQLAAAASAAGIRAFSAVPLRRHDRVLGAACLMRAEPGADLPEERALAQAMADSTAVGLLRAEAARDDGRAIDRWRSALSRQITIDQARGIVAQRHGITVDAAARLLEQQAGTQGVDPGDLAERIVRGLALWHRAK